MTNPPYVLDQLDTLAEVMEHPQIRVFARARAVRLQQRVRCVEDEPRVHGA